MSECTPGQVTELLHAIRDGRNGATDRLLELVYSDLRAMARRRMNQVPRADTLEPTALVHECYLRLLERNTVEWRDRRHFFGLAARAMHDIIVERARRRASGKRGGDRRRVSLEQAEIAFEDQAEDLLALTEALERLRQVDALGTEVVMLRFFAGLTYEQIALALDLPISRVRREWQYAKAFLHREMAEESN